MKPVGYLIHRVNGTEGEPGLYYNYILASNGIFVDAENSLIAARIPIAGCDIRGLAPLGTKLRLTYGSIPQRFFDLALDRFLTDKTREHYVAVVGDAGYHFYIPVQDGEGGSVSYEVGDHVVLELHSHGEMTACFSLKDNEDEKGLKVYGVVGSLGKMPVIRLRLGIYGYFLPLSWRQVFDGFLNGATETEEKEVITEDELQNIAEPSSGPPHHSRWLWWHR